MSEDKKPNLAAVNEGSNLMGVTLENCTYSPSIEQRELKARFWESYRDSPGVEAHNLTPAAIVSEVRDSRINSWWKRPMFKEWFLNEESFLHRALANGERGLEIITNIMNDERASDSIRLKAALAAVDVATKLKTKAAKPIYADKLIGEADEDELDRMIDQVEGT